MMDSLVLFAKAPEAGAVKTRLAQTHGDDVALQLYEAFLKDAIHLLTQWSTDALGQPSKRVRVYLATKTDVENPPWAEHEIRFQDGHDLGERMRNCITQELTDGADRVCIIGADSPTLPVHLVREAFFALDWHPMVLGPTFDGGYWLVGARDEVPPIFENINWSTASVMSETIAHLQRAEIQPHLLPFWYDVDNAEDLRRLKWHVQVLSNNETGVGRNTFEQINTFQEGNL